jgi:hypothetical protein
VAAAEQAARAAHDAPAPPLPGMAKRFGLLGAPPPPSAGRLLLVVDVTGLGVEALGRALGLPAFEAVLRHRQGGLYLHRVGATPEVEAEAGRLESEGLRAVLVPESEARVPPVPATGGERDGRRLRLKTAQGSLEVGREDILLVVEGPIQREYQPREVERTKPRTATLDTGYRFHLHRRSDPRPVELDPANFSFGARGAGTGSSLLELKAWVAALGEGVATDDGFKRVPPALSPAPPEEGAAASLRRTGSGLARAQEAPAILDNLAQFRFYSGWRAAVERRR